MSVLRRVGQRMWVAGLRASGSLWRAKRELRRRGAVVVLMLHRVLDEAECRRTNSLAGMSVRRRTFEDLAAYLARRCQVVRLSEARPGFAGPKIKVAITFDDGWRDNYANALPVALACGLPATVFVCTGLAGCVAPFWPERAVAALRAARPSTTEAEAEALIERLKNGAPQDRERWMGDLANTPAEPYEEDCTMTWEEIAELARAGVTFGSHTHTHQILAAAGAGAARREIRESRDALESHLGQPCDAFAYPNGDWSAEVRQILEEEGFRLAFTTERNAWTAESDPLLIPRANVCEGNLAGLGGGFSPAMFEYTAFWKVWRAMRAAATPQLAKRRREPAVA